MSGQDTLAAVSSGKGSPAFDLGLDNCELPRLYNGRMAVFNIVLRNLAVIDDHLLCEEIDCVGFLANHANNDTKCTPGSRWGAFASGGVHQ